MTRRTASKLQLLEACPSAITLTWADSMSSYAARGGALHQFVLLDVPRLGRDAALELVPTDYRTEAADIPLDEIGVSDPAQFATEVTLALDVWTGEVRELGRGSTARDYSDARDTEICGTLDAVGVTDDTVITPDVKTGHGRLPEPRDNAQLIFAGVAAAKMFGRDAARIGILDLREPGSPMWSWAPLDAMDLAVGQERLLKIWETTEAARLRPPEEQIFRRDPETCRYCPAFDRCPAWNELADALSTSAGRDKASSDVAAALEAGKFATAKLIADEIGLLSKRLNGLVSERAVVRPIGLGGGRYYGMAPGNRKVTDAGLALRVIGEKFGPAVRNAVAIVEESTTIGRIEKEGAAILAAERGGSKKAAAEVLTAALATAGALDRKPTLKEYTATEPGAEVQP